MHNAVEQGQVSRWEWRWVWTWSLAIVLLSAIPTLFAAVAAPDANTFGGFLINILDGNSYLAKMRQGLEGNWLYTLAFTHEDQRGIFVFTLYLALGHLARWLDMPLIWMFHLARLVAGMALLVSIYGLAAALTPNVSARRWALAIGSLGSGLAVFSIAAGRNNPAEFVPVDLFVPEAFGFYSILSNPHFPLAFALEAIAILWVFKPPIGGVALWAQCAGAAAIGFGIASLAPFLAAVTGAMLVIGALAQKPDRAVLFRLGALLGTMGLFIAYAALALQSDPAVAEWARQNVTPSPPPLDVLFGFGLWLPLAALGAVRTRQRSAVWLALVAWLAVTAALIYFPYPLQRRFMGGIFVPLAVFGGQGVVWLLGVRPKLKVVLVTAIIVFGFVTNVVIIAALLRAPSASEGAAYLSDDEVAALKWLEQQTTPESIVLADERLGNLVPGWTGARTVYGHPMETIAADAKLSAVQNYYAAADEQLLDDYGVSYVIGGGQPQGWQLVFQSGGVHIYGR